MTILGKTIGGRYTVGQHIGRGGMQEVYLAHDILLDSKVALKTPQAGQQVRRFKSSAKISARINHHNVAKTLDYVEEDGNIYLIEEFIDGETLQDKLSAYGYFDPHLAAHTFHLLAKGIFASHQFDVVHRDLKPSNIMVSGGPNIGVLKITDFGIATLTEAVFDEAVEAGDLTGSTSGTIKGALPFMAPEMMLRKPGENPGKEMDIWSLGAMMFQLLTGEFPFGVYLHAVINVQNQDRTKWPSFMASNQQYKQLTNDIKHIVEKCLSYDPSLRPTASQLVGLCEELCYLNTPRVIGTVSNLIQNGYSGFVDCTENNETSFFSMQSLYGNKRPNVGSKLSYSTFSGTPQNRAHPIMVLK